MVSFAEAIHQRILVFDGPMGTELYRHHVFTNRCFEELNLTDRNLIGQILSDYKNAGADVLTTNTFGANRLNLEKYGIADKLTLINRTGAEIARSIAGENLFVAGSIGPIQRAGGETEEDIETLILEQVDAIWSGKADFILFETLPNRHSMEQCAAAMRKRPDVPFVLSCAVVSSADGSVHSASGEPLSRLLAPFTKKNSTSEEPPVKPDTGQTLTLDAATLLAFGLNCGSGPENLLTAVEEAVKMTRLPLIVQPNAGTPKVFEGRHLYYCSPEYAATYAMRFAHLGAAAVGGCCGMTPDHIREMAKMVKPLAKARTGAILKETQPEVSEVPEVPFRERSRFAWKLARKAWVASVELVPPRGYNLTDIIEKSKQLYRQGVDAVNLPDGPRASSRISSLVVAQRILQEAHIEPILHVCCRDRNLIGMQADMLGCAASGIHNLLFITGDPPKLGLYPNATGVFDTDSIGMVSLQRRLNRGIDLGGQTVNPPTKAVIGTGLDPTALDRQRELDRFRQKVAAGAEFAITQPIFDPNALLTFLDEIGELPIPVIAGIWPLASYRNAEFMQNEVPGVTVPDSTMKRMAAVSTRSKEDQLQTGIDIAKEMIACVRHRVSGVQISAPFGRADIALAVLE
ncbi:MAG: bifunctional homocysteine S-methyltransferase/methylenetetrahydrofolate reductase [Planctomycetaceae bacterium]|nr:bifunctional homocysteine S-methyltransferase/methylenetetrahydrofolate reductase [Planctomycetaceae bacterium]